MKSGNAPVKRTVALVKDGGHVVFTSKQFEQLLKSLPHFNKNGETAPDVEHPFGEVGNITLENKLDLKNVLIDLKTRKVLGLGKKKAGLYYRLNLPLEKIHAQLSSMVVSALEDLRGDGVAGIKRRHRDLYSDGVRIFAMASGRGRLKENLESSTWRWRQDF
ncbi:hypothetical protein Tco_0630953 [Tanacetum coccineum]